ncbi:rhodanese-like domain-containing protein [Sulfurospirillum diekertiae]|uniref:Rhodanese-like domain-containing protein n=1 Tax=Sulfurospirillum diekertiae TaxID=1854492 RepID=A0A290HF69_9BACT|nr:rhodanese-like domain-containing protein [Sulfurospirillum diekertiae]ATB69881.1 rhodanese-like domain-containing protein [Sulfurospirillum diekertiae]
MSKILLLIALFTTFLFAELRHVDVSEEVVKSGIKIIDIRTMPEWKETGMVKDAIPLTFFDEQGRYDADSFMKELDKYVSKDKEFAVICRTGSRSAAVTELLSKQGYKVVNLKGGIKSLMRKGYTPIAYKP